MRGKLLTRPSKLYAVVIPSSHCGCAAQSFPQGKPSRLPSPREADPHSTPNPFPARGTDTKITPMSKSKNALTPFSQKLRREMTREERHLWYDYLKTLPHTINRQKVIGRYIVDFCCEEAMLIIELDGSQHYYPEGHDKDLERDKYLSERGYSVARYSNYDLNTNFDGVCLDIRRRIEAGSSNERQG